MRPKSCRRVGSQPDVTYFKPRGVPLSELEEVILTVDEFEAIRLSDYDGLYQEEAAVRMNVSRPTFGRVLSSGHRKIAEVLVQGKALKIEGGKVEIAAAITPTEQGEGKMNIAVSTIDGKSICGHLGKCKDFIIYETDGKEILGKSFISTGGACPGHGADHGAAHTHNVSPFDGCHAVITQGMGQGMLNGLMQAGIQPVITDQSDPDTVVLKFLKGELSGTTKSTCECGEHEQPIDTQEKGKVPVVHPSLCMGCGLCTEIAPHTFKLNKDDLAEVYNPKADAEHIIQAAIESCLTEAISWKE